MNEIWILISTVSKTGQTRLILLIHVLAITISFRVILKEVTFNSFRRLNLACVVEIAQDFELITAADQ